MEVGEGADPLWLVLQHGTTLNLSGQKARRGWEEEQLDARRYHHLRAGMPAGAIEDQQRGRSVRGAIVNTSAVTVGSRNHSVWPEAGCTNVYT